MIKFLDSLHFCGDSIHYVCFAITYVPPKKRFMRSPKNGEIIIKLLGSNSLMSRIDKDRIFIIPTNLDYGEELECHIKKISTEISNWLSSEIMLMKTIHQKHQVCPTPKTKILKT